MASSAERSGQQAAPALAERLAVVTGASSGIGRATALLLAGSGARVVLVGRSVAPLEQAAAEIGGEQAVVCSADVATEEGLERVREATGGVPDIVVHAAGAFELAPLAEMTVASFDRMVAVNLRGAFLLMRGFLPGMLARGTGHIVTIGSIAGRQAFPHNGAYSASKFGVRGLHAVLAAELRGTGVRATFVEPAATDTPLWDAVDAERSPGLPPRSAMLDPHAVAEAVLFAVTRQHDVAIPIILVERA
jgi:NADP-dependent 3-hydroxy acid dehydrogenase YdfG